jgi:hypothetical protein
VSDGRRGARRLPLVLLALGLAVLSAALLVRALLPGLMKRSAAARGFTATWSRFDLALPLEVRLGGLTVIRNANADTLIRADSLAIGIDPWSLLLFRTRLTSIGLARATFHVPARRGTDADPALPEGAAVEGKPQDRRWNRERAARLRNLAHSLVDILAAPAHQLPHVSMRDVALVPAASPAAPTASADDEPPAGVHIAWLLLRTGGEGVHLAGEGRWIGRSILPFMGALDYRRDDRLTGLARIAVPATGGGRPDTLRIGVHGALTQDGAGGVTIPDTTRLAIGTLRFRLGGLAAREGPRFRLTLGADTLTARQWQESLPRAVLGPLLDLSVRGWYGYRVTLDLDFARPDSVGFSAVVQPHGLRLDSLATRLDVLRLGEPFTAAIHLPHDRIVTRELSPANPHFRTLAAIDSLIANAVVTNEDGGFYRHRGFNTEAVKSAIADNVKAGAYRRGAGTITMQLVRNLYLGHQRTLSRKGQEVVLAWVLEHLTTLSKARMLEIYLNIIEWGPEIHGADEAAHYYFGHDAGHVTVDEALFLATVVPAPTRWRNRLDAAGVLRPFARAQMHFIGRAMVAKGRLSPELLPPADSLRIELRGPAREILFPFQEAHADTISK